MLLPLNSLELMDADEEKEEAVNNLYKEKEISDKKKTLTGKRLWSIEKGKVKLKKKKKKKQ